MKLLDAKNSKLYDYFVDPLMDLIFNDAHDHIYPIFKPIQYIKPKLLGHEDV